MYLLVFVTLMIAIIGTYSQVMGLQAARFSSSQSATASAMMQWHAAAVSMAASIVYTSGAYPGVAGGPGDLGCALTANFTLSGMNLVPCPSPIFYPGVGNGQNGTVTTGGSTPTLNFVANHKSNKNECVRLSAVCAATDGNGCVVTTPGNCLTSYDITNHQFYSFLYRDSSVNQNFVVTFVPAPTISASNPAPGYISMVNTNSGWTLSGLTISDLMRELNHAGEPNYGFGTFQNVTTTPQLVTSGPIYNLPKSDPAGVPHLCVGLTGTAACTANGSVAIIGSPDGF